MFVYRNEELLLPEPEAFAVLGEVCSPRADSSPLPDPVTLRGEMINLYADSLEDPFVEAVLGAV
jgi:hypothetical protein